MPDLRNEAIGVVFAQDPRRAAEGILEVLLLHVGATAAALFRASPGEPLYLFAGCSSTGGSLIQVDLDRAGAAWDDGQASILEGHPYTEDAYALVPIGPGAVVYIGSSGGLQLDTTLVDQAAPLLLAALDPPRPARLERPKVVDVEATPTPAYERERLKVLLDRNEGNIARVARILGVHRPSVYRQLRRLGIPRVRPPKKK